MIPSRLLGPAEFLREQVSLPRGDRMPQYRHLSTVSDVYSVVLGWDLLEGVSLTSGFMRCLHPFSPNGDREPGPGEITLQEAVASLVDYLKEHEGPWGEDDPPGDYVIASTEDGTVWQCCARESWESDVRYRSQPGGDGAEDVPLVQIAVLTGVRYSVADDAMRRLREVM